MKKLLFVIFLFTIFHTLSYAPNLSNIIYIPTPKSINIIDTVKVDYQPLLEAIGKIETDNRDSLINIKEEAYGRYQIRRCRINHYNKLTGKNYTLKDMHDSEKAREVFLYFVVHNNRGKVIEPKTYEQAAKNWNGSGPMTEIYWQKVQSNLQLDKGHKV